MFHSGRCCVTDLIRRDRSSRSRGECSCFPVGAVLKRSFPLRPSQSSKTASQALGLIDRCDFVLRAYDLDPAIGPLQDFGGIALSFQHAEGVAGQGWTGA